MHSPLTVTRAGRWLILLAACLVMTLALPVAQAAQLGQLKQFKLPTSSAPRHVTTASDGNLWFTVTGAFNEETFNTPGQVARVTPDGDITEFTVCDFCSPNQIAEGPDGILYFGQNDPRLGRITTSGEVLSSVEMPTTNTIPFEGLAADSTSIWFTDRSNNRIGRYNVFTETLEFFPVPTPSANLFDIAVASDGAVWFTESNDGDGAKIGRLDPVTGAITETNVTFRPRGIAIAPDGTVWFTAIFANRIGRLTPSTGEVTHFPTAEGANPADIVAADDGNLWFTQLSAGNIARITPEGVITEAKSVKDSEPLGITMGPDNNPWYAELAADKIATLRLK